MHIGIIMDGNRRWAKEKGLEEWRGHVEGGNALEKILDKALEMNIQHLTVYTFSSENLKKRSEFEKEKLFELMEKYMKRLLKDPKKFHVNEVKVNFFGRVDLLSEKLQKLFTDVEKETGKYNKKTLNFCIVYDGRDEIVDAIKNIIKKGVKDIDRETIKENIYSKDIPPPELIIRTGMRNAMRLSGFLLWDSAYSEFYFTETYWPAFTPKEFEKAVKDLKGRERRYGG